MLHFTTLPRGRQFTDAKVYLLRKIFINRRDAGSNTARSGHARPVSAIQLS